MRLVLTVTLVLLFLWLQKAQRSCHHRNTSEASFKSELLLWPLFLYSWMASMLLQFIKSISLLFLSVLHYSILLFLAGPWFVTSICTSLLLTGLHVALYLLLMVLVVGVVTILTLKRNKVFNSDAINEVKRRD